MAVGYNPDSLEGDFEKSLRAGNFLLAKVGRVG
jgi:hypothetical protein